MVWQRLTADSRCDVHEGTVINYARGGLHFETDHPIGRRAIIWVLVSPGFLGPSSDREDAGLLPITAVEIRWSREIREGDRLKYGIGGKYC